MHVRQGQSGAEQDEFPVLITHGTSDDNVYFMHSLKHTGALFRAGKPVEFVPLSGLIHMCA